MITPAKERMRKSRAHRRLGLRPVQVLVTEREIDFLLARHYELTRADEHSRGVSVPVGFGFRGGMFRRSDTEGQGSLQGRRLSAALIV